MDGKTRSCNPLPPMGYGGGNAGRLELVIRCSNPKAEEFSVDGSRRYHTYPIGKRGGHFTLPEILLVPALAPLGTGGW
jgi:hypothetical protein